MRRAPARAAEATALALAAATVLVGCGAAPVESVALPSSDLTRGLFAHWSFDEKEGSTTVADHGPGPNRYDGTVAGTTFSWIPAGGRFAGGLRLKVGDSVTIPNFPSAATAADWTVSVWIKLSKEDKDAFTADRAVLLTAERPSMGGWEVEFDPRPGFEWLEFSYYAPPPTGYVILRCRCIDVDRWMQFTAVVDATNNHLTLYRDGRFADGSMLPVAILPGDTTLGIGRWSQSTPRSLSGTIDDYAIWSRALTADEVATLNARPAPDAP